MASTYYIKAYYTKQNQQQPEIRRFAIDISPENDLYQELCTKIASFQSDNQLNNFTLQYSDEEDEHITFSTNDELRSAIAINKGSSTLKVFVTFNQQISQPAQQQQQQRQQDSTDKECHVGVECDGCKGPVIGFRYKCFVCPNYDLCEKCSSAGVHSEHNMIKITKPGNFHHPNGHHPHGPHQNGHHQRHFHGHGHRHRHGPSSPSPPPPPPAPFVPGRDLLDQIQSQIPQWLPNRENTAHFRAHMQHHLDSIKNNTQSHVQNSKQYLESVGQYLQQALSPFGIDCDYHVDEKTAPTATTTTETTQQEEEQVSTSETTPASEASAAPTSEASAVPKYPDLIIIDNNQEQMTPETSTKITNPLDKAVEDCMERLKAMGFPDANGALIELIRSKQGDINAVLDAINPRHHQA